MQKLYTERQMNPWRKRLKKKERKSLCLVTEVTALGLAAAKKKRDERKKNRKKRSFVSAFPFDFQTQMSSVSFDDECFCASFLSAFTSFLSAFMFKQKKKNFLYDSIISVLFANLTFNDRPCAAQKPKKKAYKKLTAERRDH